MEDYEVRDTMRRAESPSLELKLTLQDGTNEGKFDRDGDRGVVWIRATARNCSPEPAHYPTFRLYIDNNLTVVGSHVGFQCIDEANFVFEQNSTMVTQVFRRMWGREQELPMLEDEDTLIGSIRLSAPSYLPGTLYPIGYEIRCPRTPSRSGAFGLRFEFGYRVKIERHTGAPPGVAIT